MRLIIIAAVIQAPAISIEYTHKNMKLNITWIIGRCGAVIPGEKQGVLLWGIFGAIRLLVWVWRLEILPAE